MIKSKKHKWEVILFLNCLVGKYFKVLQFSIWLETDIEIILKTKCFSFLLFFQIYFK